MSTSLVPKMFNLSPVYVFNFCSGGWFFMTAHDASLITVTVSPVSTSMVI